MKATLDFAVKYIGISGTVPAATDLYAMGFLPTPPIKP
jgi:NitT/TauT family transport system substrate-binding protein